MDQSSQPKMIMSSTRSLEKEQHDECMRYDTKEESSICGCGYGLIGFRRNQVMDYNLSRCSSSSSSEIGDDDDDDDDDDEDSEELFEINLKERECLILDTIREECESTVFSLDIHNGKDDDVVYVAVGTNSNSNDGDSSMEALSWTLKHAVTPSSTVCLVHVFPQVNLIPSPLGKIPRSRVNVEHVNMHLTQVKSKRKLLLHKFVDLCINSKVKVEMMLIEGDNVAKAIVDLVGNLNIRKLVIGISKSNLSKSGSRRQNVTAAKVLKDAQESCDLKIICEGREVIDQMIDCTSPCSIDNGSSSTVSQKKNEYRVSVPLKYFMSTSLWLFRYINKMR